MDTEQWTVSAAAAAAALSSFVGKTKLAFAVLNSAECDAQMIFASSCRREEAAGRTVRERRGVAEGERHQDWGWG